MSRLFTPRCEAAARHGRCFADLGVEAVSSAPEQFAAFIRGEMDKYAKLIKEANIKVNQ